jgi:hypothetical protein
MSILESRPPFSECVIELTDKEADSGMRLRAIGGGPRSTMDLEELERSASRAKGHDMG